jgi:hypothetical protein
LGTQHDPLASPTAAMEAPFGTVVQIIREAFTERSVSAATYDAAVSLLGVPLLVDLITLAGTYASTAALLEVFDMQLDRGETHLLPSLELLDDGSRRELISGRRSAGVHHIPDRAVSRRPLSATDTVPADNQPMSATPRNRTQS